MSSSTATDAGAGAALGMLAGVLACYAFAALGWVGLPAQAAFIAVLGCAAWALSALRDARAAWMLGVIGVLLVLALGSPSDGWDPRSIWLFHARRIFLDGSLYTQLDGYAPFSHNDYPALVPVWMATAAKVVGHWNEIFPKAAATLLLLPALLLIARSLRTWWVAGLFAVALLKVGGSYLVDGYMDALLAVIVAVGVVAVTLLRERRVAWGIPAAFALSLLPLLAWKLAVSAAHLSNDLAASDLSGQLMARLPDLAQSMLIVQKLLRGIFWVPLALMLVLWSRTWRTPVALAGLGVAVAYACVLYAVYLGTPHDLEWHLATSARRTVLPVLLLLMYALLVLVDQWNPAASRVAAGERNEQGS